MGADMFVRGAWIARGKEPDFAAMRKAASEVTLESLERTDDAEAFGSRPYAKAAVTPSGMSEKWEASGPYEIEFGSDGSDGIEDVRKQLARDIDEFENAWNGKDREAAGMDIGPYYVMCTGGMSWGDSPSELYECMNRLDAAEILHAGGFYREVGVLGLPFEKAGNVAQALGTVLIDREHPKDKVLAGIADAGAEFEAEEWDHTFGPATDRLALYIDLPAYPEDGVTP